MTSITVLVRNELDSDPRVYKMVNSLTSLNVGLNVVCFVGGNKKPAFEKRDKYDVYRFESNVNSVKNKFSTGGNVVSVQNKRIDKTILAYFYILYLNLKLVWLARNIKTDIYHANDFDTLIAGYILSKINRAYLVYDAHELYSEMYSDYTPSLKKMISFTERFLIKRCWFMMTVNKSILNEFDKRYRYRFGYVVMNCPNYQEIKREVKTRDDLKIIYLGSYQEERGLEDLVSGTLFEVNDNIKLYMRGSGPLEQHLRDISVEGVRFLNPVPMKDIVKSLVEFDVGIIPYVPVSLNNQYSTPNKLFEYMMSGCVVLSSDLPEIRKVIEEYQCGNLYGFFGDCEYAIDSYKNKNKLKLMGSNSLRAAKEKYNWEKQVEDVLKEYKRLIDIINK